MKYRKRPIEIDAIIFTGENYEECKIYIGDNFDTALNYPNIITSEGTMRVNKGDYIIKEPFDKERGFYPCKPDVFKKTYEESNKTKRMISLEDALRAVDEWLNSDNVWVTDVNGNKIKGGLVACKPGSMSSGFISKMRKILTPQEQ